MKTTLRLEIRRNNAYDSLLLLRNGKLVSDWPMTPKTFADFMDCEDLEDWDQQYAAEFSPEDFGDQVIAYREQVYYRNEVIEWDKYMIPSA